MTDHEKFNNLLEEIECSREEFADFIGIKYTSLTNQLAPSKELPRWAKSALIIERKQTEQELCEFFKFFRDYGERLIGLTIDEFVKTYIKHKNEDHESRRSSKKDI